MSLPVKYYRRQGAVEEPQLELGADYEGSGTGDDYWNDFMQSINVNNGRK